MPQCGKPRILGIKFFHAHPERVPDSLCCGNLGGVIAIVIGTSFAALPAHRLSGSEVNAAEPLLSSNGTEAEMRKTGIRHRQKESKAARPLVDDNRLGFEVTPHWRSIDR